MPKAMKLKLMWKLKVAKLAILSVSRTMSTGEEWAGFFLQKLPCQGAKEPC